MEQTAAFGIFYSAFFPQVSDESSTYCSPIAAINDDIRRKYSAAAAASAKSFQLSYNGDPWESGSDLQQPDSEDRFTCLCHNLIRRGSIRAGQRSPRKLGSHSYSPRESLGDDGSREICPLCGGRRQAASFGIASFHKGTVSFGSPRSTSFADPVGEPQHAEALLYTTPHLRFLCPASTDMQGTGNSSSKNIFARLISADNSQTTTVVDSTSGLSEYDATLIRERANKRAAAELSSVMFFLAHEMSIEDFGAVESEVLSAVFALVHSNSKEERMAGLAAVDSLLSAPSADDEKKAIKFANTLSNGLRVAHGDFEFLSAVSKALGHMATRSANVDFVESEVTRALEWLRAERSDRRLGACLALKEFAIHAPTTFHSKTSQSTLGQGGSNEFIDHIFKAIRDPQPIVRACAADSLSQCLGILVERRHLSLTGLLCQVYFALMEGLQADTSKKRPWHAIAAAEASQHGSLLAVSSMLEHAGEFMLPRYEEVCTAVFGFMANSKTLIQLEVIRLIPRLARACPRVFGRYYLDQCLQFLIDSASNPVPPRIGVDLRPAAYIAIGYTILSMSDESTGQLIGGRSMPTVKVYDDPDNPGPTYKVELCESGIIERRLPEIFALVCKGLRPATSWGAAESALFPALHCAASLVEALEEQSLPFLPEMIDVMFSSGLSTVLIRCLYAIFQCIPELQGSIEDRLLQEVSLCLAGDRNIFDPVTSFRETTLRARVEHSIRNRAAERTTMRGAVPFSSETDPSGPRIIINSSDSMSTVSELVLSLQTLASFGGSSGKVSTAGTVLPMLPFVQDVAARYLCHPSAEVRRAAALTCCALLIPYKITDKGLASGYSGIIVEDVLDKLVQVASTDPSDAVRLCVVRALDSRYDIYLSQSHHVQEVMLLLYDETLSTRAAAIQLLGRLASINPALIHPALRKFLDDLIIDIECGVDSGRGREEATQLLVVLLRCKALQRLIQPVLPSLLQVIPLDRTAPPRLASASLEALGELAQAAGTALLPWVKEIVPHVLLIMQDQSSASKQRTSLRTLGQIAGSTGYVVQPYIDHPNLLAQATDVLPATKRAPWSLRREVIRTLGILGALDPDRYHAVSSKTRKAGTSGGAYFDEVESNLAGTQDCSVVPEAAPGTSMLSTSFTLTKIAPGHDKDIHSQHESVVCKESEDDQPAYLFMYEQYAMVAQPVSHLSPPKRVTPSHEDFYPTVAIQALVRIFRDQSLAVHHGMVIQAIMFIFKSLGIKCVSFLPRVTPHMIYAARTCGPSHLRETLLTHLAALSLLVREHIRPYVAEMFSLVEEFWSTRHMATLFTLVSNIAIGSPDEFQKFAPRLIKRFQATFDELQASDWTSVMGQEASINRGRVGPELLRMMLKSIMKLKGVLGDYHHILVPSLLKLGDHMASRRNVELEVTELSILVFRTISTLIESHSSFQQKGMPRVFDTASVLSARNTKIGLPSRVVQPIIRILRDKPPTSQAVGVVMVDTLCICAIKIGSAEWLRLYDGVVREAIATWQGSLHVFRGNEGFDQRGSSGMENYEVFIRELLLPAQERPLTSQILRGNSFVAAEWRRNVDYPARLSFDHGLDEYEVQNMVPVAQQGFMTAYKQKVNQGNLQRAWDVSQRTSRDDWDEWMRRFAIQLLRESPSPALRAAANLAHAYQPLARELFSAAFSSCWRELSEHYRLNLVNSLETAFTADVSPEILQALLNLAEFMEHDPSGGLPIDIPILAELALKCRAYAKALHYREREYNLGASSSCVESLISINRKLDLQEAALGVLKVASSNNIPDVEENSGDELSTKFGRHYSFDMHYSVMWNTDDTRLKAQPMNLTAQEELWLAKLGSWTEALAVYEEKLERDPSDFEAVLGCMRCLVANGEWRKVLDLAGTISFGSKNEKQGELEADDKVSKPRSRRKALKMCAESAWRLSRWSDFDKYSKQLLKMTEQNVGMSTSSRRTEDGILPVLDFDAAFYAAVLHIHRKEWAIAADALDAARRAMDGRLTALMAESYSRAYPSMVAAQTLAEMEEIIEFRKLEERSRTNVNRHPLNRPDEDSARERLIRVWRDRLDGCRADSEVHSTILAGRSLILGPEDDVESILRLSELSRQAQRLKFAERVLLDPLRTMNCDLDGPVFGFGFVVATPTTLIMDRRTQASLVDEILGGDLRRINPTYGPQHEQFINNIITVTGGIGRLGIQYRLYFAYVRHLWFTERREEAMRRLTTLSHVVDAVTHFEGGDKLLMLESCLLELGEWKLSMAEVLNSSLSTQLQAEVLTCFKRATLLKNCGYRAWHAWALMNFRIALQMSGVDDCASGKGVIHPHEKALRNHIVAAVNGFVNAINIGTRRWSASVQQDLLNLVTCLFRYGKIQDVPIVINQAITSVALEAWLGVLPQLLARIHIKEPSIRSVLHPLLTRIGEKHPQALMYPLSVLLKSPVAERKNSAESLMNSLKAHSSDLVEQALLVSSELIRVAILWLETWHEGLEEASRLYFAEGNVSGMLELLLPLHETIECGAATKKERDFLKTFGQDLTKAHLNIKEYIRITKDGGPGDRTRRQSEEAEAAMNRAWDIYYTVFRLINKQLPSSTQLHLTQCSPALSRARSLELGVPGSYRVDGSYVKIEKFISKVHVITSKQRPRKITLRGSDGNDYMFLLKGHEDLRQDERVMQLFGLVNALLVRDPQTKKHDLKIQRYAICPLSHNCGIVGWVPHCDTLHSLIRDYRGSKKIPLNMENREMLKLAPDYDLLTMMQKVEIFTDALRRTTGQGNDLYEILWLKSTNSEEWLERRTRFTRSLAVMSIVGYILGLGDRHPSNLMLDKASGRILHIDFGDCFEVAMNREKFPEKVPFRLTRMLVKAMEVSGIEGSYRSTCERTMSVLRDSRDSLVAMLEAFVYDPLISWRLVDLSPEKSGVDGVMRGEFLADSEGQAGVSIEKPTRVPMSNPITEILAEDDVEDEREDAAMPLPRGPKGIAFAAGSTRPGSARHSRSHPMYAEMQAMAANLSSNSRIASIGGDQSQQAAAEGSMARSRIERSMRHREIMSLLEGEGGEAHEETLNEKALKVIRRVQDKLSGNDFPDSDGEPLDVSEQVQRLIVQATSTENLSQLFIGWCAFW